MEEKVTETKKDGENGARNEVKGEKKRQQKRED